VPLPNDIVLRPRFQLELNSSHLDILESFEQSKKNQSEFLITISGDHIFLKIPKEKQHFWSPQLHLEILEIDKNHSKLFGLFGPNPTVWTLFMFLHFIVIGLFIGFSIWTYTNWTLANDYAIQLFITLLMIVIWFVLYFGGRMGKSAGKAEMHTLHDFMTKHLKV
jgi:hypothetical protein